MPHVQLDDRRIRIAGAVVFVILVLLSRGMSASRSAYTPGVATKSFATRSAGYCNAEQASKGVPRGEEGLLMQSLHGARLEGVVMSIRHGDRSAIHLVPGAVADPIFDCSDLPAWPASVQVRSETTGKRLADRELLSDAAAGATACPPGTLTARGARQLAQLGAYVKEVYGPLIDLGNMTARSTDYRRTLGSAAFFMAEMLGGGAVDAAAGATHTAAPHIVTVYEDEALELMHGVGLASKSAGAVGFKQKSGDEEVTRGCAKAIKLGTRQQNAFRKPHPLQKELAKVFGREAANKTVTDLGDAIHAGSCHGLPMPCGYGGCLSSAAAADVLSSSDHYYCARYTGSDGGSAATRLALQPFLRTISDSLQAVADGHHYGRPLKLFFGHDTVIAPVLAALDVYDCKWPPYASRVAFELWRIKGTTDYGVRVIYNGRSVTRGMRGCAGQDPCPLERFRRTVQGLLNPAATLDEACAV